MLVSWLLSAFRADHYARRNVSEQDLKIITIQLCSYLLAAGVMKKLEDDASSPSALFRVSHVILKDSLSPCVILIKACYCDLLYLMLI